MKPSHYNLIIGILSLIVLIVPFFGKVFDNRRKLKSKIRPKGWVIIIVFILGLVVAYQKDFKIEEDEVVKENLNKQERKKADSIYRKLNDESNSKTISTFTNALARYGLRYDSAQKEIAKLVRDSNNRKTSYRNAQPNFTFIKMVVDTSKLARRNSYIVSFLSQDAGSYDINIKLYILIERPNNIFVTGGALFAMGVGSSLGSNQVFSNSLTILETQNSERYYFLLKGSYRNIDQKSIPINKIFSYEIKEGKFGIPVEPYYSDVSLKFIELFKLH